MERLTIPPLGHPLYRPFRVIPAPIKEATAFASQCRYFTVRGVEYAITAHMQLEEESAYECCDDVTCDFMIIEPGKDEVPLGRLTAKTVITSEPTTATNTPLWVENLLQRPPDDDGNLLEHSDSEDSLSDFQKVLQILFNEDGEPKEDLAPALRELLHKERVHYIETFCLNKEFRGRGLAKPAMMAYFNALNMNKAFGVDPAIILSPAPLQKETEEMRKAGLPVKAYDDNVEDIGRSYEKSGFKWAFKGGKLKGGSISIMARASTDLHILDDGRSYLNHRVETTPDLMSEDVEMTDADGSEQGSEAADHLSDSHDLDEPDDEDDETFVAEQDEGDDPDDDEADIREGKKEICRRQRRRITVMRKVPTSEAEGLIYDFLPDAQPTDRFDTNPDHYPAGARYFQTIQPQKNFFRRWGWTEKDGKPEF